MRIKDHFAEEDSLNMTAMIDMVFLLLIFFLVATRIAEEEREIGLQLPNTGSVALTAPPRQLIINVREDGATVVRGKPCDQAALLRTLADYRAANPGREVLVRADERSLHRYFASVLSLCKQAGINEVKVGYLFDSAKPVEVE